MATFDQPTILPLWCQDNQSNVVQPPDSLRATGYTANEPLTAEMYNWQLYTTGQWLGYLQQANAATVMSASLDLSLRLVGGGNWTFNAGTSTLAWDDVITLQIPSIPGTDNTIAAGNVVLGDGTLAYVQANVPYTAKGSITSGDTHVTGIQVPSALAVGQSVTGVGIPAATTVTAISGGTLTLSQAATATNNAAVLTFAGSGPLTMQTSAVSSLMPTPNTVVLAIGREMSAIVGANSGQMVVRDGESKRFMGVGYVSTYRAPAGAALTQNQACYLSNGTADGRTQGSIYPCDAGSTNGANRAQFLGFATSAFASGATTHLVTSGTANGFSGLTPGKVYWLDPTALGGITAAQPTSVGQYAVPVGFALSNTTLRINPSATQMLQAISNDLAVKGNLSVAGTSSLAGVVSGGAANFSGQVAANTFSSVGGFKSCVRLGCYFSTNTPVGTSVLPYDTVIDQTQSGGAAGYTYSMPAPVVVGYAGSLTGITTYSQGRGGGNGTLTWRINGVGKVSSSVNTGFGASTYLPIGKGQVGAYGYNQVKQGDAVDVTLAFANGGYQGMFVWLWFEFETGQGAAFG